ncbi:hypothetical protein [Rhodopila sp.]|uniref:hypothetical protein n=1 Tax=Rhodopila sp. TaxID=2480087 RepID=UPI003D0F3F81
MQDIALVVFGDGESPDQAGEVTPGSRLADALEVLDPGKDSAAIEDREQVVGLSRGTCLTLSEIVVRTNYSDKVHKYDWSAVMEIHGICWTHDWKKEHFLGGSVNLELQGGIELPVNLRADDGSVSPNYRMLKAALTGKAYQY